MCHTVAAVTGLRERLQTQKLHRERTPLQEEFYDCVRDTPESGGLDPITEPGGQNGLTASCSTLSRFGSSTRIHCGGEAMSRCFQFESIT